MPGDIRLVIVDDHPLMRRGIRETIESSPGLEIVGEAGDGKTALAMLAGLRPEIVILDIGLPGMDGFAVAREIRTRGLGVEIVFLTAQVEQTLFEEALALGGRGYVLKESAAADLVASVRAAAAGHHYVSPALTSHLVRERLPNRVTRPETLRDLTDSEMRILRLVAEYKTTREIAETLHLSPLTVETHRRNMCEKLGIRGSNALVKFALAHQREIG